MPRYSDQFKDEIRKRIRVSDIAGKRVKLKRAGRELVGLSPFTNEKTPSFYVIDTKQMFKCFSSGLAGDVFTLFMEFENCDFPTAVQQLADMAGLELPKYTPEERQKDDRRKLIMDALADAQKFFASELSNNEAAMKYIGARKIDAPTISKWGIGYAPASSTAIPKALQKHGPSVLVDAGLTKKSERGAYGFYRDRLMFPIRDQRGRVVSFGGRTLDPEKKPKYINGPESPVFHKSNTLYGMDTAKDGMAENREARGLILSEGYLDVIAFERAGLPIAVAPLGTSVTASHLREIWRWGSDPIICLDGDAAGQRAALRLIKIALPEIHDGLTLRFAKIPRGQDPDDVLRQKGPRGLQDIVSHPTPLPRKIWEIERAIDDLATPEKRTAFRARLNEHLNLIAHKETAKHYREAFYQWTRDFYRRGQRNASTSVSSGNIASHRGLGVLVICIDNPDLIDEIAEDLVTAHWSAECKTIFETVFQLYEDGIDINRSIVIDSLLADFNSIAAQMIEAYPHSEPISAQSHRWERVLKSIHSLKPIDQTPVTLTDAIQEHRHRRAVTKK